ncbi:hypothetical protein [Acetobacter conturbans]|uniref:Uncharacterized protein n=1 Tax=Acetobacter conturbans TaxID=1737472 RepID=A0ABX0K165_9PROT|nr:hypothetical protein [Acetobacter conturbans]NHN89414.1 hypothetical protein [Acetobacter conturbans]
MPDRCINAEHHPHGALSIPPMFLRNRLTACGEGRRVGWRISTGTQDYGVRMCGENGFRLIDRPTMWNRECQP